MFGKKVVVKFKDGKILKGWTVDFSPQKEVFHLDKLKEFRKKGEKSIVEIELSSLRVVFFVKDFKGNKNYKNIKTFEGQPKVSPSQRRLIVISKDGEKLYGTTLGYHPNRKRFFLYPIDPKDNNERIFVIKTAVKSVDLVEFDKNDLSKLPVKKGL